MVTDGSGQLLAGLLPAGVAVAESFGDEPEADLHPEEAAAVAGAAERRRREFAAVRACARTALAALGVPPVAVPPGGAAEKAWARRGPGVPRGGAGGLAHLGGGPGAAVT